MCNFTQIEVMGITFWCRTKLSPPHKIGLMMIRPDSGFYLNKARSEKKLCLILWKFLPIAETFYSFQLFPKNQMFCKVKAKQNNACGGSQCLKLENYLSCIEKTLLPWQVSFFVLPCCHEPKTYQRVLHERSEDEKQTLHALAFVWIAYL